MIERRHFLMRAPDAVQGREDWIIAQAFIPIALLHSNVETDAQSATIEAGWKTVENCSPGAPASRIAWASYFFLINGNRTTAVSIFHEIVRAWLKLGGGTTHWYLAFTEVSPTRWTDVIRAMDGAGEKAVQLDPQTHLWYIDVDEEEAVPVATS